MTLEAHPAAGLFPLLTGEELRELADDIGQHGLREPVWMWRDPERGPVMLDGRNRERACELAGVPLATRYYTGDDPITFSISQNLKRRHLTTGQKAAVAVDAEPLYAAEAARRKAAHGGTAPGRTREQPEEQETLEATWPQVSEPTVEKKRAPQARERAAKTTGTSGRSVARFKRLQEQADDLAKKVRSGNMELGTAERIVRDREAEQRRVAQARQDAANLPERPRVDIRHGDFREVLADLTGVDAVITDPPYPREYLPLLGDLAAWADKVLTPDGVLAVLFGQTYLPEVYRLLDGHRPYRWTMAYLTPGNGYASHLARVQSNWKPVLVYGGGPRFSDVLRSEGTDAGAKDLHRWGQDYGAFHTLIERLTRAGQTVVDPFAGSGTTLLAAHALGRHVVGADTDEAHVATARERLA